ncbi:MAG TPA: hypothetical protein VKV25_07560, partial [Acidimicrobiales bacterium]|nr:hypothetical protein [Acidimicrobiales bacterium]
MGRPARSQRIAAVALGATALVLTATPALAAPRHPAQPSASGAAPPLPRLASVPLAVTDGLPEATLYRQALS